jgi:signal transduction histidine kinase
MEAHRSGGFEAKWHLPDGRLVLVREHRTSDGGTVVLNDILDLSKIESGMLALREELMDVADIVDRVVRMIQGPADAAKLAVSCEISRNVSHLWADIWAVKQVLLNLLYNAVKFTPEGGEVRLAADIAENGGICFTVSDIGIGISSEDIHKVLQPFGQVGTGLSRNFEGTGLGLPLAKSLTELHGGEFEIISRPNAGTTVRVTF